MQTINIYPLISTTVMGQPSAYARQPLAAESTCACPDRNELQPVASSVMHGHRGTESVLWFACHTCGGQEVWRIHYAPGEHADNIQSRGRP